jgi:hypothetical protein
MSTTPNDLIDHLSGMPERTPHPRRRRIPIWLWIVLGTLALASLGALAYLLMPLDAPLPDGVTTHYAGLERGFTEQGFAWLGSPDASVLVEDFSSYACPHCRTFHEEQFEALLDEIAAGEVQFVLIPVPHIGAGAETAAKGALCAGEQAMYWEMHDVLFYWQSRFFGSVFHPRRIEMGAEKLGLDTDVFSECINGSAVQNVIDEARREFERRQLTGTPTLFVNGRRVRDYIELETLGEEGR